MIKLIVKLAVAALLANAAWRIGQAYLSFYRLKDSVTETALYGPQRSDDALRARVVELAGGYDVPIDAGDVTIRHDQDHVYIDASYTETIEIVPGLPYDWPFTLSVDGMPTSPASAGESPRP